MASLECAQFISKEVSASCSFFFFPFFFSTSNTLFHFSASVTPKMKALIAPARAWVELQRTNGGEHSVIKAQKGFFSPENFRRLPGSQLNREWVGERGFTEPILLNTIEGSGLWFNHGLLDVNHIVDVLGRPPLSFDMQRKRQNHPSSFLSSSSGANHFIPVIDVATLKDEDMSLSKFAAHWTDPASRTRVLNVLGLNVSDTELGEEITLPGLVRELGWAQILGSRRR